MLLSNIFDSLAYGELAQLKVGGSSGEGIQEEHYPAIVSHLNLALTAIFGRFPLLVRDITIQQYADTNLYYIKQEYATNGGSTQPVKYVLDSAADPFTDAVLKIEGVKDDNGDALPFNDTTEPDSLITKGHNKLYVPNPVDDTYLTLSYRAGHPRIDAEDLEPDLVDIDIPPQLEEPLLYYMAHRAHARSPRLDGVSESDKYLGKYEASCKRIEIHSLIENNNTANDKPEQNGWV